MKYFVISDIHNCYDETVKSLTDNHFDFLSQEHKIIFLGDAFEKGKQPKETYLFLQKMMSNGKLIWVRGNHDMELINAIKSKKLNKTNRNTAIALAQVFSPTISTKDSDEVICNILSQNSFDIWIKDNSCNYFELDNYIFVHGYIPLDKGQYNSKWKMYSSEKWAGARKKCAVREIEKNNIRIPGKTVVCGHVGAYYGHIKENYPNIEFDSREFKKIAAKITRSKPFNYYCIYYGNGVISIDANAYDTGFMNCIVIEEKGE